MQPAFRALGPPLPTSFGEPVVPTKLSALKRNEEISGIIGMASFPMLNSCFASR
jgi:hypothetical protein